MYVKILFIKFNYSTWSSQYLSMYMKRINLKNYLIIHDQVF